MSTTTRPTRTSTLLATVISLAVIALFVRQIAELRITVAMGIAGVICLVVCLALVATEPDGRQAFFMSLLTVPVAIGFVGGLLGTMLLLVSTHFPVASDAEISLALLRIFGSLGLGLGVIVAVFGITLGYQNVLAAEPLTRFTKIAFVTAVVPFTVGFVLFVRVVVAGDPRAGESVFGDLFDQLLTTLLSPGSTHLHLGSFLFVVTISIGAVVFFLRKAPVAELVDTGEGMATLRRIERLRLLLYYTVVGSALLMLVAVVLEVVYSPQELRSMFGSGFDLVQLITTAGWLRLGLFLVALGVAGWVVVEFLLRQYTQWPDSADAKWIGPLAAGTLLTGIVWLSADSLFERGMRETTMRLPDVLAVEFQDLVLPVVDVYGETAVVILSIGVMLALTAWVGLVCWVAVYVSYLSDEGAGFSIASAGLLLGTISLGIATVPSWHIFLGVVGALVVWDLGQFGTRLGREVGAGQTRTVEFVHAGATLLVGAVAVVGAMALESRAAESSFTPGGTTVLALICLVIALVAFSLALRKSGLPFR